MQRNSRHERIDETRTFARQKVLINSNGINRPFNATTSFNAMSFNTTNFCVASAYE